MKLFLTTAAFLSTSFPFTNGLTSPPPEQSRRATLQGILMGVVTTTFPTQAAWGAAAVQDSLDTNTFLRTGMDIGGNMGVSSQAGKSRPETGVFLR
jgi:hypothetical protein